MMWKKQFFHILGNYQLWSKFDDSQNARASFMFILCVPPFKPPAEAGSVLPEWGPLRGGEVGGRGRAHTRTGSRDSL